jgi:hypothetical protein
MYGISLCGGGFIRSAEIQAALANVVNEAQDGATADSAWRHLCQIEHLEARGMLYSNQDFDVLSSALNFLDAVSEAGKRLRAAYQEAQAGYLTASDEGGDA